MHKPILKHPHIHFPIWPSIYTMIPLLNSINKSPLIFTAIPIILYTLSMRFIIKPESLIHKSAIIGYEFASPLYHSFSYLPSFIGTIGVDKYTIHAMRVAVCERALVITAILEVGFAVAVWVFSTPLSLVKTVCLRDEE